MQIVPPTLCSVSLFQARSTVAGIRGTHTVTRNGSTVLSLMEASFYFSTYGGQFDHYHNERVNLVSFI